MKKDFIKVEMMVKNNRVSVIKINGNEYISLTDLQIVKNQGFQLDIG